MPTCKNLTNIGVRPYRGKWRTVYVLRTSDGEMGIFSTGVRLFDTRDMALGAARSWADDFGLGLEEDEFTRLIREKHDVG